MLLLLAILLVLIIIQCISIFFLSTSLPYDLAARLLYVNVCNKLNYTIFVSRNSGKKNKLTDNTVITLYEIPQLFSQVNSINQNESKDSVGPQKKIENDEKEQKIDIKMNINGSNTFKQWTCDM